MKALSFKDRYELAKQQPTPREQFINKIAELTNRSPFTVKKWLMGLSTPDINTQRILSKYFKAPVEELFPEAYKEDAK